MTISYLPWATTAISAFPRSDPARLTNRPRIAFDLEVSSTDGGEIRAAMPALDVLGPGDVLGFGREHVVRTDPPDGAKAADTTTFVCVDLDTATLPWMIAPVRPTGARAVPWICLVVVEDTDGVTFDPASGRLTIAPPADPSSELPDLADAWAWAHVQYTGPSPGADQPPDLTDTSRSVARLLCGRVLAPRRRYHACVVPTWAAGRDAALGLSPDPDAAPAPAWTTPAAPGPLTLPVYHHTAFTTGEGGDFLSLATLIADAPPWQPTAGTFGRRLHIGWTDAAGATHEVDVPAPCILSMEPLPDNQGSDAAAEWLATQLLPARGSAGAREQLTLPIYGAVQAAFDWTAPDATLDDAPVWLRGLACDPRLRVAAGWGCAVVGSRTEELVASAFEQVGDARAARAQLSKAQLGRGVGQRQLAQHLGGSALVTAQVFAPQSDRVVTRDGTLAETIAARAPDVVRRTSAAYRRVTRRAPLPAASASDADLARTVSFSMDPAVAVARRVFSEHLTARGPTKDDVEAANDKLRLPQVDVAFQDPMLPALIDLDPPGFLPDFESLPSNTATLLQQDSAVIGAFLVGLNHGLQRLLQWRDVPTNARATAFRRFWSEGVDIDPIDNWDHDADLDQIVRGGSVLVLRSDLFRRYPRTVVYAHPARSEAPHFEFDPTALLLPRFSIPSPPDIRLLGFDVPTADLTGDPGFYVVFQEQVSETRFGTDGLATTIEPATSYWTTSDLAQADPAEGGIPASAAAVARLTAAPPALVAVHASRLLPVE